MSKLIDDLYDLSLADVGALAYRKEPLAIVPAVERALGAFRERLAARRIAVETRFPEGESLVVDGDHVHVSGTTGFDYATMTIDDDVAAQTHQCFRNIAKALTEAGCSLDDAVRVRYYLTDAAWFDQLAPIFGQYFAHARPAATALVCGLIDARMKIEIEVTARRIR